MKYRLLIAALLVAGLLLGGTVWMDQGRHKEATSAEKVSNDPDISPADVTPQKSGSLLKEVATTPARTIAFLDGEQVSKGTAYQVVFEPYGLGSEPETLLISISTSQPTKSSSLTFDLSRRNALVHTNSMPARMKITKGGTYAGTITLAPADASAPAHALALVLTDASLQR